MSNADPRVPVDAPVAPLASPAPAPGAEVLPSWRSVLVVIAHPDDESFGLGGLVGALADTGAQVEVLCFTRGEASTLGGELTDLALVRAEELAAAGTALGTASTILLDRPDGHLGELVPDDLLGDVDAAIAHHRPDGLLVFDPVGGVTGHEDHAAASRAAVSAAQRHGIPVLGWALPTAVADSLNAEYGAAFVGYADGDLDITVHVDRARQQQAIAAHASQAVPGSVLWRRLELLGDREHLRWLHRPEPTES
jgi:LmbE family N-acetylglucosaminyl deacetylase